MPELSIASFNMHWGRGPRGRRFPPFDVVEAGRHIAADVVLLQESWAPDGEPADHERIADALDMDVVASASLARSVIQPVPKVVGRAATAGASGDGGWHVALLSRLPVLATEVVPLPHLWLDPVDRAVLAVRLDVEGSAFEVRGTHLPHLEMGVHLSTSALRRTLPPPDVPAALVGDMNMWGWSIDAMAPPGWRRVVTGKTWPAHRPHSQIDHLLVTPPVRALRSVVGPDLGSDHLPIRAVLQWD